MRNLIKKTVPSKIRLSTTPFRRQFNNYKTLTFLQGHLRSSRSWEPIGSQGNCIPWYTYPAIEYLDSLDFSNEKVLEFGSGNSTLWWANRAEKVVAIEDNKEWHSKIQLQTQSLPNVEYHLAETMTQYCRKPSFDEVSVVVVDGVFRGDCVKRILSEKSRLETQCKLLIMDNSDWLPNCMQALTESLGWVEVDFHGFAPINGYCHTTSLFINPKFSLKRVKPLAPIGGVRQDFVSDLSDLELDQLKTSQGDFSS